MRFMGLSKGLNVCLFHEPLREFQEDLGTFYGVSRRFKKFFRGMSGISVESQRFPAYLRGFKKISRNSRSFQGSFRKLRALNLEYVSGD